MTFTLPSEANRSSASLVSRSASDGRFERRVLRFGERFQRVLVQVGHRNSSGQLSNERRDEVVLKSVVDVLSVCTSDIGFVRTNA